MRDGGPEEVAGVREGDILAGKYRVERVLGVGGMGVVVAAHHLQLNAKVAIKFLLPEMLLHPDAVARFSREAQAAVRIKSEHVARVHDVGTLPNGAPYIVMEFLEGGDLAGWLKQRGPLPLEQAVDFVLQACVAIADAHGIGIVHRDLKPANLFCVRGTDGQLTIKILDFGISKVTDGSGPGMSVTKTTAVMGSPLYMSPEQMRSSKSVTVQTDLWALGVILFELLTGRTPFHGDTLTEVAVNVATEPLPPLRRFRPDAPPGLEAVIARCLQKDPRARYANVGELALALLEFGSRRAKISVERISGILQSAGLSASALALPPSPPAQGTLLAPGTVAPVGRTAATTTRGKTAAWGVATFCGIAAIVSAGVFIERRPASAPPTVMASEISPEISVSAASAVTIAPPPAPRAIPTPSQSQSVTTKPDPTALPTPTPTGEAAWVDAAAPPSFGGSAASQPRPANSGPHHPNALAATAPPVVPVVPASSPKPLTNCKPPYTIDAAGHRQYKPECL